MSDYKASSYADERMQMERYYDAPPPPPPLPSLPPPPGMKKANQRSKSWGFDDPEFQRKKRVATYKTYSVKGKVKGSFRKSFSWLKARYSRLVYGT